MPNGPMPRQSEIFFNRLAMKRRTPMSYGPMWESTTFEFFVSDVFDFLFGRNDQETRDDVAEFINEQNLSKDDFFIIETYVPDEGFVITVWYRKRMSKSDVIKEIKELKYLREELEKNKNNIKNKKIKEIEKELEEIEKELAENIEKTEKDLAGEIKEGEIKELKYLREELEKNNEIEKELEEIEKELAEEIEEIEREIEEINRELVSDEVDRGSIARGLAGLDSDKAWKMREKFLAEGVDKTSIAQGLAGLDSDRAWKMRKQLLGGEQDRPHG